MDFFKLSNGDITEEHNIAIAFQVTTGIKACNAPELYSKFLHGLFTSGYAKRYSPTVMELALSGNMSYACLLYREQNGVTLMEAKKAVMSMLETAKKR